MGRTVAVVSQKGGSGKTTLALHFAIEAMRLGTSVAIIDHDPQGSAMAWAKRRQASSPVVDCKVTGRLEQKIASHAGAGLCLIDTAPHTLAPASEAAKLADLVIIPCRPGMMDLDAIGATILMVQRLQKPGVIVLNQCPHQGTVGQEMRDVLARHGLPVCPYVMTMRVAYSHALIAGQTAQEFEPNGKAALEVAAVWNWLEKM